MHIDGTDIRRILRSLFSVDGIGQVSKTSKRNRIIRRWCLDKFGVNDEKLNYQKVLRDDGFSGSIKSKVERGMKGHAVVMQRKCCK